MGCRYYGYIQDFRFNIDFVKKLLSFILIFMHARIQAYRHILKRLEWIHLSLDLLFTHYQGMKNINLKLSVYNFLMSFSRVLTNFRRSI